MKKRKAADIKSLKDIAGYKKLKLSKDSDATPDGKIYFISYSGLISPQYHFTNKSSVSENNVLCPLISNV